MNVTSLPSSHGIEPKSLVGTKWIGWSSFVGDKMAVEFTDEAHCIYTSMRTKYPITYTVEGNKIFFEMVKDPFELRGRMLFSRDIPAFKKMD